MIPAITLINMEKILSNYNTQSSVLLSSGSPSPSPLLQTTATSVNVVFIFLVIIATLPCTVNLMALFIMVLRGKFETRQTIALSFHFRKCVHALCTLFEILFLCGILGGFVYGYFIADPTPEMDRILNKRSNMILPSQSASSLLPQLSSSSSSSSSLSSPSSTTSLLLSLSRDDNNSKSSDSDKSSTQHAIENVENNDGSSGNSNSSSNDKNSNNSSSNSKDDSENDIIGKETPYPLVLFIFIISVATRWLTVVPAFISETPYSCSILYVFRRVRTLFLNKCLPGRYHKLAQATQGENYGTCYHNYQPV